MRHAVYNIIEDGTFVGEVPGLPGVWANAKTLESCRDELQSVIEGWILLGLRLNHRLPVIDRLDLNAKRTRRRAKALASSAV
jgi:predicted RNase H-like HicB family nuclease